MACKEWNNVPVNELAFLGSSYDNTGTLGANTWRHVSFAEQDGTDGLRWLMNSDVCKHCAEAGCLDVCPTGAIFRTEFGSVVVQAEVCNGCGYCIPACPFGVIARRDGFEGRSDRGTAQKCTLCYDRLKGGLEPACAQACPTKSIQFGLLSELQPRAQRRVAELRAQGHADARLYLADERDNAIGGAGAFFLLMDEPAAYRFPEQPLAATRRLGGMWASAAAAMAALAVGVAAAALGER